MKHHTAAEKPELETVDVPSGSAELEKTVILMKWQSLQLSVIHEALVSSSDHGIEYQVFGRIGRLYTFI